MINSDDVSLLQRVVRSTSDVASVDFGPNSTLATGSSDKCVMIYEWKQGIGFVENSYCPLKGHKYGVTCVRFSPIQPVLASSSVDGTTKIWSLRNGECLLSLVQAGGCGVRCISFSTDGSLLATAGEGGILCLWSIYLPNYSLIRALNGHDEESVQGVSISPDGMIIASGDVTGTFKLWSVGALKEEESPTPLYTVRDAHDLGVNYLEFSPHHTIHHNENEGVTERHYLLTTCGNDHWAGLWEITVLQAGKGTDAAVLSPIPAPRLTSRLSGHSSAVSQVRVSPNGDFVATSSIDNTVRIWLISTGRCLKTLEGHARYATSCAFSSDQTLIVTGSNDKSAMVWDLTGSYNLDSKLPSKPQSASHASYASIRVEPNGSDCGPRLVQTLKRHSSAVNSLHFGASYLVSGGSDHRIVIWNWSPESRQLSFSKAIDEAHRYSIHQVEFCSKNGTLVSCSLDGTAVLWEPDSGMVKKAGFHVSGSGVRCVRFSPDSHLIAAGGDDDEVAVYRADTCDLLAKMSCDGAEGITCIAISDDSCLLMCGASDGHCRAYCLSPTSTVPIAILENAHDLGVNSTDFSQTSHGQQSTDDMTCYEVATCGNDCLVKVWTIRGSSTSYSVSLLWCLSGHGGSVTCVRYSPSLAEMLASTSIDKTCRLWDSYSGVCLHIVEGHEGILTCCSFSPDASLLATGAMDRRVLIWELPKDLAFRSFIVGRSHLSANVVESWTVNNVNHWLEQYNLPQCNISGRDLLHTPIDDLLHQLNIEDEDLKSEMKERVKELRKEPSEPPDEYLCPITHQIMRDPVVASDGHSYERAAIELWLSTGRTTSPMTNAQLESTSLQPNPSLRQAITLYLTPKF